MGGSEARQARQGLLASDVVVERAVPRIVLGDQGMYIFLRQQEKKKRGQPCTEVLDQDRILVVRAHLHAEPRRIRMITRLISLFRRAASYVLRSPAPGSE